MRRSLLCTSLACGLLLSAPASAASIRVRESSSVRISTDENGTVTHTVEERREERVGDGSAAARASVGNDGAEATVRGSYRSVTCVASNGGRRECNTVESGDGTSDAHVIDMENDTTGARASARVSVDRDWWVAWQNRLLKTFGKDDVAAEEVDEPGSTRRGRMQARLARRICTRLDGDERTLCLLDAVEEDGSTVRARLRAWIDRLLP